MFEDIKNIIEQNEIITPIKFMENSDVVYAGVLPTEDFKKLDQNRYYEVTYGNGLSIFKTIEFSIKENDIIFCHTLFIDSLFEHLKKISKFKNLKLITSQTDIPITNKLFNKKPECISQWFSINVSHIDDNLIPIPLGIVGDKNKKNLTANDLEQLKENNYRENKIYVNFNLNTNYFHRFSVVKQALKLNEVVIERPNMNLNVYANKLSNFKFSITPWGNGIDTHRMWESVYSGCIPITQNHLTFRNMKDLPIIFLDSYKNISMKTINNYQFENINFKKLKFSWWLNLIKETAVEDLGHVMHFSENKNENINNAILFGSKYHKSERRKKYSTFFRKVHKKIFGREINNMIGI